jgi:tellurite resistance protein TehA-like permease
VWVLTLARAGRHPNRFFGDMADHGRGPGFFTAVAATSIVGSQFVTLEGGYVAGAVLCVAAAALWTALTCAIFAGLAIKAQKPALEQGLDGSWLLAVVATQSVAVLIALLAARAGQAYEAVLNFVALSLWLAGAMLYVWIAALIFFRLLFLPLFAEDLSPTYWINMGAMAISTLAGALLVINAPASPLLLSLLPFIKGVTLGCWATGTWWMPMLAILFLWRHVFGRVAVKYEPQWWGAVFPLGMYSVGTEEMGKAMHLDFLALLPPVFLFLALAAWALAMVGLVRGLLRGV